MVNIRSQLILQDAELHYLRHHSCPGEGSDEISPNAMGRAMISEIIEVLQPLEEGLLLLGTTRHVSVITITLSRKELDTYQLPIPADQVKPLVLPPNPKIRLVDPLRNKSFPVERFQPRRLLKKAASSSITSLSIDPSKLKGAAMKEPQTSVEDSLRKRPPSNSNPSHN
ncbi:hypothetical protein LXL04_012977 [Taraxacum kok-saghyz]